MKGSTAQAAPAARARIERSEDIALFPTHVKIVRWQTEPGFNERLSAICMALFETRIRGKLRYHEYNLWDDPGAELLELRRMFETAMGEYIDGFMSPRIKKSCSFEMQAWLRIDRPKEVLAPHAHPDVHLVATYYPQVDIADRRPGEARPEGPAEGSLVLNAKFSHQRKS